MFSLHGMLSVSPFNKKTGHIEMNHDVSKETIFDVFIFSELFRSSQIPSSWGGGMCFLNSASYP